MTDYERTKKTSALIAQTPKNDNTPSLDESATKSAFAGSYRGPVILTVRIPIAGATA